MGALPCPPAAPPTRIPCPSWRRRSGSAPTSPPVDLWSIWCADLPVVALSNLVESPPEIFGRVDQPGGSWVRIKRTWGFLAPWPVDLWSRGSWVRIKRMVSGSPNLDDEAIPGGVGLVGQPAGSLPIKRRFAENWKEVHLGPSKEWPVVDPIGMKLLSDKSWLY